MKRSSFSILALSALLPFPGTTKERRDFLLHSLAALLATLSLAGCVRMPTWFSPTFSGQVVEQATGQPIAGAIVVGLWEEVRSSYVHSRIHCIRVESATTDAQGRYRLLRPGGDLPNGFYVYKPGYRYIEMVKLLEPISRVPDRIELRVFTDSPEERLDGLLTLSSRTECTSASSTGTRNNLLPLKQAMLAEARSIARTSEHQKTVNLLLSDVEELQMDYRAASARALARERERLGK